MTKTTLRVIHHLHGEKGAVGPPSRGAHTSPTAPPFNFPTGRAQRTRPPSANCNLCLGRTRVSGENTHLRLAELGFGIRTPAMFSKANLPAGIHSRCTPAAFWETLITRTTASQCCSALLRPGKRTAFKIIAQPISRWHRRRARVVSRPARISGQACGGRREVRVSVR